MSGERTMEGGLQRLLDKDEIQGVLHRYCRHLDAMELDALADLFTADCLVEYGPDPHLTSRGKDRLASDLARMWRWARTSHHLSNIEISFDPELNEARAISYLIAWHERPDRSTATLYGQYHDRLIRTAAGWRIAHRKQFMNGNDAGFTVNIHPFARQTKPG